VVAIQKTLGFLAFTATDIQREILSARVMQKAMRRADLRETIMRVAIYARVSTEDKGQDPENQLRDLRAWRANSGHDLVGEYVNRVSGRKGTGERKRFAALFEDTSRRKLTVCCSGRLTALAARAWCQRSNISNGSIATV
jgi:predicted site-specific integrase-resolvase